MIPDAFGMRGKYGELAMPVVIIAGELDRLIDTDRQSGQLHRDVGHSTFHSVPGAQDTWCTETAMREVMAAIDEAAGATAARPTPHVISPAA